MPFFLNYMDIFMKRTKLGIHASCHCFILKTEPAEREFLNEIFTTRRNILNQISLQYYSIRKL